MKPPPLVKKYCVGSELYAPVRAPFALLLVCAWQIDDVLLLLLAVAGRLSFVML